MAQQNVGRDGERTIYLQGGEAREIEQGRQACDACNVNLADAYDLDRYGNVEVYGAFDDGGDLVGLLCPYCATGEGGPILPSGRQSIRLSTPKVQALLDDDGDLPALGWPGGYPISYITTDGALLCAACATAIATQYEYTWPELAIQIVDYSVNEELADDDEPGEERRCDECSTLLYRQWIEVEVPNDE